MKKSLVAALTAALTIGVASTTFAAANPFSDVPADHWAYDAVTQLAQDGVIEGYGDGTFRGQRNITRYEMAQMIAKAMARTDVSAADKALIDKLAAEFADELNNLGVRVANLERNADKVKWNGQARLRYIQHNHEDRADDESGRTSEALLRLEPSAEVNSNWHVKARIDASVDYLEDEGSTGNAELKRLWAQGDYDNFQVKLGKFAARDDKTIMDNTYSGAEVSFGNEAKIVLGGGRMNVGKIFNDAGDVTGGVRNNVGVDEDGNSRAANYYMAGVDVNSGKFDGGLHYHGLNFRGKNVKDLSSDKDNILAVNAAYRFDNNNKLSGFYAHSTMDAYIPGMEKNDDNTYDKNAWGATYNYKGAQKANAGTWGAWAGYRHYGLPASPFVTTSVQSLRANEEGWVVGADYTFFKNVVGTVEYAHGNKIDTTNEDNDGVSSIFGQVQFFF